MLAHAQICRAYLVFADVVGVREGDRYLIVLPFFHSFGLHATSGAAGRAPRILTS